MKILLVRNDGIGDALACAPLVAALHAAGHTLGAVLGPGNAQIFARDAFAHVHVLERIPWPDHGSTPTTRRTALAEARAIGYDVALIASEEIDAYTFARDAGIKKRVGFINGWEKPLKSMRVRTLLTRALVREASAWRARDHEAAILFALGEGLHVEPRPTRDVMRLRRVILDGPVECNGCVVLQVSRKHAHFGLSEAAYAALARELMRSGHSVLFLGDEPALTQSVAHAAGMVAASNLDTATWKARIAGARAVVTPDSGAAHVAGFTGVPCVDCFVPHSATVRDIARWRPWTSPARAHVLDPTRDADALAQRLAADVRAVLPPRCMAVA
ncbi:MAG: glycosyltransferase family 9 protein [Candidatus Eremiobacteraeota bacterium]|nr:glycosyltransferase family 9 protein [Candidatus Eremiobacteraeota bacterium]MBC5804085.1 glycosyltransferase family 9 protein [Candidatus Eremiobacteraeota bacterium]MBC5821989.1 glycosyltransferase family 9 protein [Candidatus Eremiobacteraeota bacterium]